MTELIAASLEATQNYKELLGEILMDVTCSDVFVIIEFEFRGTSNLMDFIPFMASQDSNGRQNSIVGSPQKSGKSWGTLVGFLEDAFHMVFTVKIQFETRKNFKRVSIFEIRMQKQNSLWPNNSRLYK